MGSKLNIGVYIGQGDKDIAAWFNMIKKNGLSQTKWIRGLIAAHVLGRPLSLGTVDPATVPERKPDENDRYKHGWQVRGPNGEFCVGSVINVSVSKAEVLPVFDELWGNGHQAATFLKALIRKNLAVGDKDVLPDPEGLRSVWADYIVSQANQKIPERQGRKKAEKPDVKKDEPKPRPPKKTAPEPAAKAFSFEEEPSPAARPARPSSKAFSFTDEEEEPKKKTGRNPLLDMI